MTADERTELQQHWDYLFSIPPEEVKDYEWRETATEMRAELALLREALAFARSVIKCGEPWTATCERVINGALADQ